LRVVSVPDGIDCGITCTATFPFGTEVTLEVVSGAGDGTIAWAGDCQGMETCKVTMDSARAIELSLVKPASRNLYLPAIERNQP
jgi:endoglucanase